MTEIKDMTDKELTEALATELLGRVLGDQGFNWVDKDGTRYSLDRWCPTESLDDVQICIEKIVKDERKFERSLRIS